ncbi:phenylalanyl-tRNA synthetase alpha subunit [Anaerobacterium chartisolvens]|uniref:Phenylalanine--tRNA ligase alpha subunit n=1 Tax=Anaerobacterium chartisolvens TaxID=1297424 RepID=A0A369BHI4_9FIRM|nr:phenylalanine--tRNA ligase subunit alpha [Anaerobacterium chartisolvens]RCX21013.1 phenylalanyl-tRNA synthetase alpha subunit [Anaerobacterium chartisolvens]
MAEISEKIKEIEGNYLEENKEGLSNDDILKLQKKYLKTEMKNLYDLLKLVTDSKIKKDYGRQINELKKFIEDGINEIKENVETSKKEKDSYDYTILKRNIKFGKIHPLIKLGREIEKVFTNMGFAIVQGPEIELDRNNFEKLNMPAHHPARDMQDTFYIHDPGILLRSHTSSVQIRTMEKIKPPFKIVSPGTVYRVDDIDPQHTPMFYQIEGLVVGEKISFSDLKGLLTQFIKTVFGDSTQLRFRPSYYPYTEPSAAIDMSCIMCGSKGCRTCNYSGWITMLGAGMVHPNVLEGVGYDSEKYSGLAFGLGLNRLALIYYGLSEIRKLYENDISLWEQL